MHPASGLTDVLLLQILYIPLLDKFNGDPYYLWEFINQCHITFLLSPKTYQSDAAEVGLIISLLSGDAWAWVSPLLEIRRPPLSQTQRLYPGHS
uniref:DUF4939 domain-containing protein n=1 Tax=Crocodylus porosus TaxID=8502 RepID=A0A7M4FCJ2_CROPO